MSKIDSIINDMISNNNKLRDTCEQCGKSLYIHGTRFCSPRCEKIYKIQHPGE